jgi:hypothetical protein
MLQTAPRTVAAELIDAINPNAKALTSGRAQPKRKNHRPFPSARSISRARSAQMLFGSAHLEISFPTEHKPFAESRGRSLARPVHPSDAALSPWKVTFAQTTSGTSPTPKFNQTSASSNVMHVGGICTNGIFCTLNGGNRDLADSISIAIDRGGSAALVWTDQGNVLHGPIHITYGCVTAQQSADVGASPGLSCKGPLGP